MDPAGVITYRVLQPEPLVALMFVYGIAFRLAMTVIGRRIARRWRR
jgi:hypothetical protein